MAGICFWALDVHRHGTIKRYNNKFDAKGKPSCCHKCPAINSIPLWSERDDNDRFPKNGQNTLAIYCDFQHTIHIDIWINKIEMTIPKSKQHTQCWVQIRFFSNTYTHKTFSNTKTWTEIANASIHIYSISQEICTRFCCALLCCGYAIVHNEFTWSIYPYSSGLLCWHWGNR